MNVGKVLKEIAREQQLEIRKYQSLPGGDINAVFLIQTSEGPLVIKINDAHRFPGMFDAEKDGLDQLRAPGAIDIPEVLSVGTVSQWSYLLLEYKPSGPKAEHFVEIFGTQLAALHRCTAETFGFSRDNFIGSLPQQNQTCGSATEFYITQRLEPQIRLAWEQGYSLKVPKAFHNRLSEIIPDEPPSLIHGDLWNGNFLVNAQGYPCLIDPATAFAPREMDLAMMHLFGGFDTTIFEVYQEEFPLSPGFKERIPLWQLYYLLVHLNLFGQGYRNAVENTLQNLS